MEQKDPLDTIMSVTYELGRIFRHRMAAIAKGREGINFLQLHAMVIIHTQPGITMKELADQLHVTSPSATSFAQRLVKLKWVKRLRDDNNRKLVRLQVTQLGRGVVKAKQRKRKEVICGVLSLLDQKDQESLARILQTLFDRYTRSIPPSRP